MYLIDATIMYPEGKPLDVLRMFFGLNKPCDIYVHYKKYPISEVPTDTEALTKWLYDRYEEKDKMLARYYETGTVPEEKRPLHMDHQQVWCILTAFFVSTLIHIYIIRNIVNTATVLLSVLA